ncbi:MAG: hypothetical protein E6Q66_04635 [Pedobacter sp.]|nr:MAG: hypothetical protein E6Q66_04635 [Pedobacter sp.]
MEVQYPDGTIERKQLPASWEEMNRVQLLQWSRISLQKMEVLQAKISFVKRASRFSKATQRHLRKTQLVAIAHQLKFLNTSPIMSRWVVPSFRHFFRRYYGPGDALSYMTIGEFRITELCFQQYLKTGKKQFLVALAAAMYRPKNRQDLALDIRRPLGKCSTEKREKRFKYLSPMMLQAILLNYEGCRAFIQRKYAPAFKQTKVGKEQPVQDLQELIETMAGEKLGPIHQVEQTNIHRFFRHLVGIIQEAKEVQKQ